MRTQTLVLIFFCILVVTTSTGCGMKGLPSQLRLQDVRVEIPDLVPMELMERVADVHASEVWGIEIGRGAPLPIINEEGQPVSYAFPFVIGRRKFPAYNVLFQRFRRCLPKIKDSSDLTDSRAFQSYLAKIGHDLEQFGTVYVSATTGHYPVFRISHMLHPYFHSGELALALAKRKYAVSKPRLSHIRFIPPCYEYFEITGSGKTVRLHVHTLLSEDEIRAVAEEFQPGMDVPEQNPKALETHAEAVEAAWAYYAEPMPQPRMIVADRLVEGLFPIPSPKPPHPGTRFVIPDHRRIPSILWTRWCAPTAAAMVLSFWDHYVPIPGVGTCTGYERIVDYWLDHPDSGQNVPNLLDELVNIKGPNWVRNMEKFTNTINGYNWAFDTVLGNSQNDWGWDALVSELNTGRPLRWQFYSSNMPHANCAFGYRIASDGAKYVILYNTWHAGDPDEWHYNSWLGVVADRIEINRYVPGGAEKKRALFIRHPRGGEIYRAGEKGVNDILFYAGSDIKTARLEYSTDGGRTWSFVAKIAVNPGWNICGWMVPSTPTTKARIRIQGLGAAAPWEEGRYLAGDGSYENFTIE